ncbi:MAG: TIGR04348 family glycosyltransferase [Acidobacteria bacterium]|nr:MAG: TIGR04348 family glycosyltransferase [Acidobacteriota bacterium]
MADPFQAHPHRVQKFLHTGPARHLGRLSNLRVGIVNVFIVTPESAGGTSGNSITAMRWAGIIRALGNEVTLGTEWQNQECDVLIALHARRSYSSVERFRSSYPNRAMIVALTGTDLYHDLQVTDEARRSLALATRIVGLQNLASAELDEDVRGKLRIIYQSAQPPSQRETPRDDYFEISVLAHLRDVKDPMRAALASRALPPRSRIRILHAGRAIEAKWEQLAVEESRMNPRYHWLGEQPHDEAIRLLARSRVTVLSSLMEGGSSAIAEAVVCGVPILCSKIPGNIGMLGPDFPGYFQVEQTGQLAELLTRAETDPVFLRSLKSAMEPFLFQFTPEQERESWIRLLGETNAG